MIFSRSWYDLSYLKSYGYHFHDCRLSDFQVIRLRHAVENEDDGEEGQEDEKEDGKQNKEAEEQEEALHKREENEGDAANEDAKKVWKRRKQEKRRR